MNYNNWFEAQRIATRVCMVTLIFISVGCSEQHRESSKVKTQQQITTYEIPFSDIIANLPQIESYKKLLFQSNRNLKIWSCDTLLIDSIKYNHYHVGEDNGTNLLTAFHFAKRTDNNNKVFIYDVVSDNVIDYKNND